MHSLMISSDVRPSPRSVFSCILATTSSGLSEPPFTPMRTGLLRSRATPQIVANCSSRRRPVPTVPGLIRLLPAAAAHADGAGIDPVLVERVGAVRVARQQEMAVVVEVADQRSRHAGVEHALLDL